MSTLQVTFNGQNFTFAPGATVRIGRSSTTTLWSMTPPCPGSMPCRWEAAGWVWQNSGQAPTFLAGQPVAQFAMGQQVDVNLAPRRAPPCACHRGRFRGAGDRAGPSSRRRGAGRGRPEPMSRARLRPAGAAAGPHAPGGLRDAAAGLRRPAVRRRAGLCPAAELRGPAGYARSRVRAAGLSGSQGSPGPAPSRVTPGGVPQQGYQGQGYGRRSRRPGMRLSRLPGRCWPGWRCRLSSRCARLPCRTRGASTAGNPAVRSWTWARSSRS